MSQVGQLADEVVGQVQIDQRSQVGKALGF